MQLPAVEFKRNIKNEIREVTAENIMKYINLDKVVQWVIKSEIGRRGRATAATYITEALSW